MTEQEQTLVADGFMTVPEALAYLRIGRSKLYDMMSDEKLMLPYTKVGRCRRIPRRALMELAAAGLSERRVET
jgi:excisionase family DNA binding protein